MVTYSNEVKAESLDVKEETLKPMERSAVQLQRDGGKYKKKNEYQTRFVSNRYCGTGGATESKPVGLVYVALADENDVVCKKLNLLGDRNKIRNNTVLNALDMIRRYMLQNCK